MNKNCKYFLLLLITGCSSFDGVRCFSIDGKQASSCQRKLRAERACRDKEGLRDYYYNKASCNNGEAVTGIN